jgi:hypothetical protein
LRYETERRKGELKGQDEEGIIEISTGKYKDKHGKGNAGIKRFW